MKLFEESDWLESKGTLIYDPHGRNAKTRSKVSDPWWLLLMCDNEIIRYANWWLKKRGVYIYGTSLYGSHISVIKGEKPPNKEAWKKYHGKKITFQYSNAINDNGKHWWYFVKCPELTSIRTELGLPAKPPYFRYHLTVGKKDP
jgi:hypothetical protein